MAVSYVVFDIICVAGLQLACYRSYKGIKDDSPRAKSETILKFWVMFGVLQFVGGLVEAYSRELKFLVVVACFIPGQGRTITPALYSNTIAPLFRKYGTPVERRTVWLKRRLLSGVSAIHRKLSVAAVQASLPSAELSELAKTEAALQDSLELVSREMRRRRTIQLKRSRRRLSSRGAGKLDELRPGDGDNDGGQQPQAIDGKPPAGAAAMDTSSDDFDLDRDDGASDAGDVVGGGKGGESDASLNEVDSGDDDLYDEADDFYYGSGDADAWVRVPRGSGPTSMTPAAPSLRRRTLGARMR